MKLRWCLLVMHASTLMAMERTVEHDQFWLTEAMLSKLAAKELAGQRVPVVNAFRCWRDLKLIHQQSERKTIKREEACQKFDELELKHKNTEFVQCLQTLGLYDDFEDTFHKTDRLVEKFRSELKTSKATTVYSHAQWAPTHDGKVRKIDISESGDKPSRQLSEEQQNFMRDQQRLVYCILMEAIGGIENPDASKTDLEKYILQYIISSRQYNDYTILADHRPKTEDTAEKTMVSEVEDVKSERYKNAKARKNNRQNRQTNDQNSAIRSHPAIELTAKEIDDMQRSVRTGRAKKNEMRETKKRREKRSKGSKPSLQTPDIPTQYSGAQGGDDAEEQCKQSEGKPESESTQGSAFGNECSSAEDNTSQVGSEECGMSQQHQASNIGVSVADVVCDSSTDDAEQPDGFVHDIKSAAGESEDDPIKVWQKSGSYLSFIEACSNMHLRGDFNWNYPRALDVAHQEQYKDMRDLI